MKRTAEVRFGCNNVCQFISDGPGAGWTTNSFVPPRCNKHCAAMAAAVCVSNTANADGPGTPFHAFSLSSRIIESTTSNSCSKSANFDDRSELVSFFLAFGMVKNVGLLPNDRFDCDSMSCNFARSFSLALPSTLRCLRKLISRPKSAIFCGSSPNVAHFPRICTSLLLISSLWSNKRSVCR